MSSAKRRFKISKANVAGAIKKGPKVSSLCHLLQFNRQTQARCQLKWKGRHPGTEQLTISRVKLGKGAGIRQGTRQGFKWWPWV